MSNLVYPSMPGLLPSVKRKAEWNTRVNEAWSGEETRVARRNWPRWRYTLSYELLRSGGAYTERAQLMGFFNRHRGSFENFLYLDEEDNAVTDQNFGTTDGVATSFQLLRPIDTWLEPVWAPAASPIIKRNGVTLTSGSDYTLGSTGLVVLAAPGSAGQALTWTGSYYMRVRFTQDSAEFERFLRGHWQLGSIELYSEVFG